MPKGKTRSLYAKTPFFEVQKYGKSQKWCSLRMKKNPQPKPLPELRIYTPKLLPIGKKDKLHR